MASLPRPPFSYKSPADQAVSWFDASMLYVRVTNCQPPGDCTPVPESLIMHFPAREIAICMELNGARIPPSEEVSLVLRRSRVDNAPSPTAACDFMYVSTDNLRTSSTLQFQILEQDSAALVVSGTIERKMLDSPSPSARLRETLWIMVSNCEIGQDGCAFVKAKQELFKRGSLPRHGTTMELCVVGKFMGEPMILTQTVPLIVKRRFTSSSFGNLNAIPEDNEVRRESTHSIAATITMTMTPMDFFIEAGEVPFMDMSRSSHADVTHKAFTGAADFEGKVHLVKFDSGSLYMTDTDQEETWYKRGISTGIKVGLGIGIGMCIGVGIGLGLIIRKFRTTTNSLHRLTL